jgi:hypothetical protein
MQKLTAEEFHGATFQSGQSGNPAGRPTGARGKAAMPAECMFEGGAEAIIGAAIDLAKAGEAAALRVCRDRIAPRPKDRGRRIIRKSGQAAMIAAGPSFVPR